MVPRAEILANLWPSNRDDQTLDVHLCWLRRKLGERAAQPRYLHTVRGVGVRLVDPQMRRSLVLVALAATSMVALAFLIPLVLVVKTAAYDRALSEAREAGQRAHARPGDHQAAAGDPPGDREHAVRRAAAARRALQRAEDDRHLAHHRGRLQGSAEDRAGVDCRTAGRCRLPAADRARRQRDRDRRGVRAAGAAHARCHGHVVGARGCRGRTGRRVGARRRPARRTGGESHQGTGRGRAQDGSGRPFRSGCRRRVRPS